MTLVAIEEAKPGMVLAEHVTDRRGRLLIPAEACLSQRHVEALRMWGVTHLRIEGGNGEPHDVADIDEHTLAKLTAEVDRHFLHVDIEHPLIVALHQCVLDRRVFAWARSGSDS